MVSAARERPSGAHPGYSGAKTAPRSEAHTPRIQAVGKSAQLPFPILVLFLIWGRHLPSNFAFLTTHAAHVPTLRNGGY